MSGRIVLTGATGFIGSAILAHLRDRGQAPVIAGRRALEGFEFRPIADLARLSRAEARALVEGAEWVIHAAGFAHAGPGHAGSHQAINAAAPALLAEALAEEGGNLVFLSSIKVFGQPATGLIRDGDAPDPQDAYGRAKWEAEQAIRAALPRRHVILRPVLVAGPGAKGNLSTLLNLCRWPVPLPFARVEARRSLISVYDLARIAVEATQRASWLGEAFIAADPRPLNLAQMIRALRHGLGRSPGLWPCPVSVLDRMFSLTGRHALRARLLEPLEAEPTFLLRQGWRPEEPAEQALQAMARLAQA
jgi:UDP-glucose 4-epimerase